MADLQKFLKLMVDLKEVEAELKQIVEERQLLDMSAFSPSNEQRYQDRWPFAINKLHIIIQQIETEYCQIIEGQR